VAGTGTVRAPVVAEIAKAIGALTIGVVTRRRRSRVVNAAVRAETAFRSCARRSTPATIHASERSPAPASQRQTRWVNAFTGGRRVLLQGVQGITDLIYDGTRLINTDFADRQGGS